MISPGTSPQLLRRGTAPPPPLPPRRASPILGNSANSLSCNQLTVPNEEAPPPPRNSPSPAEHISGPEPPEPPPSAPPPPSTTPIANGLPESRYDMLQPNRNHLRHQSCPTIPTTSATTMTTLPSKSSTTHQFPTDLPSAPPLPSDTIHYAELANISEEPSYENTIILPGNITVIKPIYSSTTAVEMPTVTPHIKTVPPETRLSLELTTSVHPSPSRASSVDSQCSSTSSHSHAPSQHSPVPAYENLNMDHIAKLTSQEELREQPKITWSSMSGL
ncbi:hypothetical protein J6590_068126 [Homalodisca vitripennis]|nr:hypothetical protein J6590_068126 [Homalodisca vitripennis]